MISPTGKGIRQSDKWGSGAFGASRDGGKRTHRGADFICGPGQAVLAPCTGFIIREARPYSDRPYSGVLIISGVLAVKLFYFQPFESLIGTGVEQGQAIGRAQDISSPKYPGMAPHIHMEITGANGGHLDPEAFIKA